MEKILVVTVKSNKSNVEMELPKPGTDVWVVWEGKYFLPATVKLSGELEE
jgi:hypothetical protein